MTMREQVERYLAFRRHQGYKLLNEERMLHDWADHAMARGDEFASAAAMIDWAPGRHRPQPCTTGYPLFAVSPSGCTPRTSVTRSLHGVLLAEGSSGGPSRIC